MFSEVEDATDHLHINTVRLKFWLVLFVGFDFCDGLHTGSRILSRFLDAYLKNPAIHATFIDRSIYSAVLRWLVHLEFSHAVD